MAALTRGDATGKRRQLDLTHPWAQLLEQAEQLKASNQAKVEHRSM